MSMENDVNRLFKLEYTLVTIIFDAGVREGKINQRMPESVSEEA